LDEESWTGIIDVGSKPVVAREAVATGLLVLSEGGIDVVANGRSPKGDVREASTIAAIALRCAANAFLPPFVRLYQLVGLRLTNSLHTSR
jgi:molybdenum cofactor biosynthesis enzyme